MAVQKLSQIAAAGAPPAVTDQVVSVIGGTTDNLVTVNQLGTALPLFTNTTRGQVPASGGVATTFLNGAGAFTTPAATSPGGANTQIQFNNAGAFGGTVGFTWDSTNQAATLASIANPAASTLTLTGGTGLTTNQPLLSGTQTWNNNATTFNGLLFNFTNTASATASRFINIQTSGTPVYQIDTSGINYFPFGINIASGATTLNAAGNILFAAATQLIAWSGNVALAVDGAGIFADRNGTNAQTVRIYNTFTDASNFERFTIDWKTTANVCYVRNENQGTGSARLMVPVTGSTTFAGLPSAATAGAGARSFITDATTTTFAAGPVGGGTNKVPVYSDGTNWLIG